MIKIAIIGGRITGMKIAFLARTAGIYTILIDKDKLTPASGLCAENYIFDIKEKDPALLSLLKNVDIVIPAVKKMGVLNAIEDLCREININVAFDFSAYAVTSSRIQSAHLIREEGLPHLKYYPDADSPYVLRPSLGSRHGLVRKVENEAELDFLLSRKDSPESWIAQEYIDGPVYTVSVVGTPGNYRHYEPSRVYMEDDFDCNMLVSPSDLTEEQKSVFGKRAICLAEKIHLKGVLEVEAVKDGNELKIMEMNSMFPSQGALTLFFSTGSNILVDILKVYADENMIEKLSMIINQKYDKLKHVVYKNFQFLDHTPTFHGESYLDDAGPLKVMVDFFGSDYAITDYIDDEHEWQAAFINISESEDDLLKKRIVTRELVLQHCREQL